MKSIALALALLSLSCVRIGNATTALAIWEQQAQNVDIIRDDWGIAHVYGKTDADAVFGGIYAQAEDDFNRVETNFINSMGRLAETEGESAIYQDLRMKIFIDPDSMKAQYATSPEFLKKLMVAWADGLNFYLAKHPQVKPRVITHFEPWMALTFSEGSIGGDIESVNLQSLKAFYSQQVAGSPGAGGASADVQTDSPSSTDAQGEDRVIPTEPSGSNGIAIGPQITASHHAMLLINPHTSFFFRSELQMTSDEGLNVYGASTWGQFFIYQGFNSRAGWMHTSSNADDRDDYLETVTKKGDGYTYRYGNADLPVIMQKITVPYKTPTGMAKKEFTVYRTKHGPIVREIGGKWVAARLMQEPVKALTQSFTRTKAKNLKEFQQSLELHTNSSNNTLFADAEGNFAYFHANFIPKRDPKFDWTKPVDGSDTATEWHGLLSVNETPKVINPANGWAYNCNNWPWSAAGPNSPKKEDFPKYVENGGESDRGLHAIRVLENTKNFTLSSFLAAAFDSYQTTFAKTIPPLIQAYDATPATNPLKAKVAEQVEMLRGWDFRWSATSVPTTLAVYWSMQRGARGGGATADQPLQALAAASDRLTADFGTWKTPWGAINRFQRLNDDIVATFDDSKPSISVMFTSANYGSLASFGAKTYPGTKKMYGTSGNSFVAVVEFGDSVHARAITAGGESGDPSSKHFNDQAERYATGNLREVYFYKAQLKGHTEREYHQEDDIHRDVTTIVLSRPEQEVYRMTIWPL